MGNFGEDIKETMAAFVGFRLLERCGTDRMADN